jgi:hypothetical protein
VRIKAGDGFLIVCANLAFLSFTILVSDPHNQARQVNLEAPASPSARFLLVVHALEAPANLPHHLLSA